MASAGLAREGRLAATNIYFQSRSYEDVYYLPDASWLRVLSLGYREALADFLWMKALLYYTDQIQYAGRLVHVFDYTESILGLDPDFKAAYSWISTAALYHRHRADVKYAWRVVEILKRAVSRWPDDGKLAWDLGAVLTYEIPPLLSNQTEKDSARAQGLPYLEAAARLGEGPPWMVLSNASQLIRLGETEQAIRHLEEMYAAVRDPSTRESIRAELAALRDEQSATALAETIRQFEDARRRDYPYMDEGLYLFVGQKPPVDTTLLVRRDGL